MEDVRGFASVCVVSERLGSGGDDGTWLRDTAPTSTDCDLDGDSGFCCCSPWKAARCSESMDLFSSMGGEDAVLLVLVGELLHLGGEQRLLLLLLLLLRQPLLHGLHLDLHGLRRRLVDDGRRLDDAWPGASEGLGWRGGAAEVGKSGGWAAGGVVGGVLEGCCWGCC